MAYALRAYYEQENNFGTTDRIEIHEDDFSGTVIQLEGRFPCAFDFEHRETTSQQRDYLSIFENQIIMGVLDLYARIDTTAKETLVNDIADAPTKQFRVEWKRNGTTVWYGYPYGRVIEYNDRPQYSVRIQFRDFEFLKGEDYPLEDNRQTIITTFSHIIDFLGFNNTIYTATSWEIENITSITYDFLNRVYHDTFALRDYASDGYSTDQNISYFEALERCAEPMLVVYQWEGFHIRQISALKDPQSVYYSHYIDGVLQSSTASDLRQSVFASKDLGTPHAKVFTNNTSYPALRRVRYDYKHRSGSSVFQFDTVEGTESEVDFEGNFTTVASLDYSGNGDERLVFSGSYTTFEEDNKAQFATRVDNLALDSDYTWKRPNDHFGFNVMVPSTSVNTTDGWFTVGASSVAFTVDDPIMLQGNLPSNMSESKTYYVAEIDNTRIKLSESVSGSVIIPEDQGSGDIGVNIIYLLEDTEPYLTAYRFIISGIQSDLIPAVSNTTIEVILMVIDTPTVEGSTDEWGMANTRINNPSEAGASIEYRLKQEDAYPDELMLNNSYFGDGPYEFSKASYRFTSNVSDITTGWRRRGQTTYVPYSRLKLNEVLDYQRKRQLKKQFQLWGEFDPISVSVFDSDNFMYVGGRYNGRWNPVMVKIEENNE